MKIERIDKMLREVGGMVLPPRSFEQPDANHVMLKLPQADALHLLRCARAVAELERIHADDYGPERIGYMLGRDDGKSTLLPDGSTRVRSRLGLDQRNARAVGEQPVGVGRGVREAQSNGAAQVSEQKIGDGGPALCDVCAREFPEPDVSECEKCGVVACDDCRAEGGHDCTQESEA